MDPAAESDLFDMFGSEFHHLCRNVDNDLTWKAAKPESSNRDVPESSVHLGSSPAFNSVDDEFPYSGIFSLTDTDQLLDAVVSNANPGGKQISGDSASCKTSVTDIPSTSYGRLKEPKQSKSSGAPLLIKNELAVSNFVKQTSFPDKAEDGCLSQNNAIQKSQIRLWIESGQNMKCESASASNSKGVDTSSKASRKRSRPGENPKPRPKDRQLIQDRIKELRELVPNGAKVSSSSTRAFQMCVRNLGLFKVQLHLFQTSYASAMTVSLTAFFVNSVALMHCWRRPLSTCFSCKV
jgi:hypothetical protein